MKNDLAENPMRLIGQITRTFTRIADAPLRDLGFAIGQLPVLGSLKQHGSLSQSELARIAQVEQPSMAQLLSRMERDGLVHRTPDENDKRSQRVTLTAAAREKMPQGKAVMESVSRQALAGFSKEERAQLATLLLRVNDNLERAAQETRS